MRPEDRELADLINRFVPVRITNFRGVDMNQFQFDYDLTFAILMTNPDGGVYSRFGTQDASSLSDRMSIPGLKNVMRGALQMHADRAIVKGPARGRLTLDDVPAFARSKQAKGECAHCHFANNFRFAQMRSEGTFAKDKLFQYPYPENIGMTLDIDRNNIVKSVAPHSPASRGGIADGDVVAQADGQPVLSAADLQFALNSIPDPGSVKLQVLRGGKSLPAMTLKLPSGWRKSDISWRASQGSIPPSVGFWGEALKEDQKRQRGVPADKLALRVTFLFPGQQWAMSRGGLQMNDVVVGINGADLPGMSTRQFHSYFRLNFDVGDTPKMNILRGDQRLELPITCIDVRDD